jgi:hypothetical protein
MKRTQPPLWSAPGLAASQVTDLNLIPMSPLQCTVIIWDCRPLRLQLIRRIVAQCGAFPRQLAGALAFQEVECSSSCNLAVVALEH